MFVVIELSNPSQLVVLQTLNVLLAKLAEIDNVSILASLTNLVVRLQFAQYAVTSQRALVLLDLKEIHIVNVPRSRKENANTTVNALITMLVLKISASIHVL